MPRYFSWYIGAGGYRRPVKGFDNQTIWINPDTGFVEVPMAYESNILEPPAIIVYSNQTSDEDYYTPNETEIITLNINLPNYVGRNLDVYIEAGATFYAHATTTITIQPEPVTMKFTVKYDDNIIYSKSEEITYSAYNVSACSDLCGFSDSFSGYVGNYEIGSHNIQIELYHSLVNGSYIDMHVISYYIKVYAGYKTVAVKKPL